MIQRINVTGGTDTGKERGKNEDAYLILDLLDLMQDDSQSDDSVTECAASMDSTSVDSTSPRPKLLIVADGMGGHVGGDKASALAITGFVNYVRDHVSELLGRTAGKTRCSIGELTREPEDEGTTSWHPEARDKTTLDHLEAAMRAAETAVNEFAEADSNYQGMGTTLTAALVNWPHLYVVHVGDSRCYVMRDGELSQLTSDHTMAELQRQAGYSVDDRSARNLLWNALGGAGDDLTVDRIQCQLSDADGLLMCTDGLYAPASISEMTRIAMNRKPTSACQELIDLANAAGGPDNITVVIAQFERRAGSSQRANPKAAGVRPDFKRAIVGAARSICRALNSVPSRRSEFEPPLYLPTVSP